MQTDIRTVPVTAASRWLFIMLAVILLFIMHLVLPSTGGSGADLPEALLVWCWLLVAIAGCSWLLRHQTLRASSFARVLGLAASLLTIPILWSPFADWRLDAFPRLGGLWAGVVFYFLMLNCQLTARQRRSLLWLMVVATLIQTLFTLIGILHPQWLPLPAQEAQRYAGKFALGVFEQRNVTGSFIATGAALLLWLTADNSFAWCIPRAERYRRWASAAVLVVMYATLTMLKSRTGWLGGGVCWLLMVAVFCVSPMRHNSSNFARLSIILSPLLGIIIGVGLMSVSLLSALHEHDGSNLERVFILQQTWLMIREHPFVGWGYGSYPWSFAHFIADRAVPLARRVPGLTYPHNEVFFWWVEGGIVALLGLLIVGVCGLWLLLRRPSVSSLALAICLLPILMHSQLEYPFYQSPVHWLFVLILLNFADQKPRLEQVNRSIFKATSIRLIPCALTIGACYGVLVTGWAFWQGNVLTAFQQSPQRYATKVISLHDIGIGSERLRKDQALSYIIRFQSSGDLQDLQLFSRLARRWIATWNDADVYNNLINVEQYLGQQQDARTLREEANRLYPDDTRFMPQS